MKRILILLMNVLLVWQTMYALTVDHLQVESQFNPAIDTAPHFSWQLHSEGHGCMQTSYQIQIFEGLDMSTLVFDTGVVLSDKSQRVIADGFMMEPSNRYYWIVTVTDNLGERATSSEIVYFDSGLMSTGWSGAQWIMFPEDGNKSTGMPRFRKKIAIDKKIKSAYIYSSALGIYDLTINGQRVGHIQTDGTVVYDELKPGWTDFRKRIYYNVHEITTYLHGGTNIIGSDVTNGWWNGGISWGLYGDYPLGFIAKVHVSYEDGTSESFVTDTSWKVTLDGPYKLGDIYDGEIYDARLEDGWQSGDYNDNSWKHPIINTYLTGELVIQAAGKVRMRNDFARQPEGITIYEGIKDGGSDYGTVNVINSFQTIPPFTLLKGQTVIFDFGQNLVGYTKMAFRAPEGTKIRLRYAEMLNDTGSKERGNDGPGGSLYLENLRSAKATSYYYSKGGEIETYCPVMTYFGFRYCEIVADNDISIESVIAIPISSVFDEISIVETDNSSLNQLFSNIFWGQLGNFVCVPTDCPQRNERWGWTGDTQVFSRTGMYNTNSEEFYRKFLNDLRDSQREDGAYPDVAPYTLGRGYGHAGWSDAGIIIPWNLYLMYGNKDILREHYDSMSKYMDWLSNNHDDGVTYAGPDIDYGDWLAYDECDKRYLSMVYYAHDANLMAMISKTLCIATGDEYEKNSLKYNTLFGQIKEEFRQKYWNPSPDNTAQSTYLLPLAFDLLDESQKTDAILKLKEAIENNKGLLSTGFLGTSIIMPTLSKVGLADEAYSLLLQRENPSWLYCIDQGATTIWERWDSYTLEKGFGPASMNSFNHYSYGAVGEWYYRYMGGIEADEDKPGFKHIILKPNFDTRESDERVNSVSAIFHSPYGIIQSRYEVNENGNYQYWCEVPANTTATLYLPAISADIMLETPENVVYKGYYDGFHVYELESGEYTLSVSPIQETVIEEIERNNAQHIIYDSNSKSIYVKGEGKVDEFILYTISGHLICSKKDFSTINVESLPNGIYIVDIKNGNNSLKAKIIKG